MLALGVLEYRQIELSLVQLAYKLKTGIVRVCITYNNRINILFHHFNFIDGSMAPLGRLYVCCSPMNIDNLSRVLIGILIVHCYFILLLNHSIVPPLLFITTTLPPICYASSAFVVGLSLPPLHYYYSMLLLYHNNNIIIFQ